MKIIHTADWHLGQTFFEYSRKKEHSVFLDWLQNEIRKHDVDLLLIAGDIFDTPNPSADAQGMYYSFLKSVTFDNPNLQIIIIAGNHDSAARLEAPKPLLEAMNITVCGTVDKTIEGEINFDKHIIPISAGGYCLAIPYLRQGDYPQSESYAAGVEKMYATVYDKVSGFGGPIIAMGHLQATGSEISTNDRSERTIIGGLELVSPNSFNKDIAYTALGHLHRAQRVSGRENLRYSGAPLPMSFAEKNNKQGVTLVDITGGETKIEKLQFDAPIKLLSVPEQAKSLGDVLIELSNLPKGEKTEFSPFLEIKIQISEPEPALRFKVEQILEDKSVRLARIVAVTPQSERKRMIENYDELHDIDPIEMANEIFRNRYAGNELPHTLKEMLKNVITEIEQ